MPWLLSLLLLLVIAWTALALIAGGAVYML